MWVICAPLSQYERCCICAATFKQDESMLHEHVMGLSAHIDCARRLNAPLGPPPPPPAQPS